METKIAGIDLGTTNSVIAIPGQYPEKGIVFGPVTVIFDDYERTTQASAVCMVDGEEIVGDDAKERAAEGYTPVRFVKKYMGTGETFRVGDEEWTPEQVSARVLRHLCSIAEKALNIKITSAVVTHPAYFDGLAIDATKRAAGLAGLNVEGRLTMEPVAAAMAYTSEDERSDLRVLVYDLGGGTFDITLVERTGGTFRPVGFGGDRELGGYNFDKKIASRMLQGLREKGYTLKIDADHPERDARWASLMHYAERLKFELSSKVKADLRIPGVFKDDSSPARSVNLTFSLSKREFLEMIEPELAKTMAQTREVLAKAKLQPEDIHHLVLVGGSCRIPAIQERLKQEFGLDPQFDPDVLDLSVAVGAALIAMTAGTTENGVALKFIPEVTDERMVVFNGRVEPTATNRQIGNLIVVATGGAGDSERALTTADGQFYLELPLVENSENEVTLTIAAAGAPELFRKSFRVTHNPGVSPPPPPPRPVLSKPILIETVKGLETLAAENMPLPLKIMTPFRTVAEMTEIPINLYQEDVQLCTVLLTGFRVPVPANCRVEIEVSIAADFAMSVTAKVPAAALTKTQEVRLPKIVVPTAEELRDMFRQTRKAYEEQLENTPHGDAKARIAAECDKLIDEAEEMLRNEHPERLQIHMLIKRIHLLTKQLPIGTALVPPKAEMDRKFSKARELLPEALERKPALRDQKYERTLDALQEEADRAYQQSNAGAWRGVAERVDEIIGTLQSSVQGPGPRQEIPPLVAKMFVDNEIAETTSQLDQKRKSNAVTAENASRCAAELKAAKEKMAAVDLAKGQQASQEMVQIFQRHVLPAKQLLDLKTDSLRGLEKL